MVVVPERQRRLHQRAYSQSIAFVRIDCTQEPGKSVCGAQSIHAFPSVRIYRGSIHAYEPYEFGREENLLWLHLVKLAAEVVISTLKELPNDDRRPFQEQVSHISQDLNPTWAAVEVRGDQLVGATELKVEVWDYDLIGSDDFLGLVVLEPALPQEIGRAHV